MRLHTCFSIIGLALLLSLNLSAQTVRVIFVSGHAELQRPDEAAAHPAQKGESVIIGTRITTGADGRVVLTPMPGVKSMIAPNTVIVLESASDTHPSATEVTHKAVLELKVGSVVSDLQKQEGVTYDYSIRTPRGLAGARGTTFTVGINEAGIQTIVVSHGTITLNLADGRQVSLTIGQVSITRPSGETEHGAKASDLSPADQALVEQAVKTTLETLSSAVEKGTDLQPDALSNALETAKNLGVTVPKELQERVDNLITNPPATKTTEPTTDTKSGSNQPPSEVLNPTDTITPPANLTAAQLAVFKSLSTAAQQSIVTLNDPDITLVALTPDTQTGLPLTDQDITLHLNALIALKMSDPASYALFKELAGASSMMPTALTRAASGGTTLPYIDNAPDPAAWSPAAFARAVAMWNSTSADALTFSQKRQIIALGAGEVVMDRSASYLSALLDAFNALTTSEQNALRQAGWGKYLSELANNPTNFSLGSALGIISGYTPAQLDLLKAFRIDPKALLGSESNQFPVGNLLTALGTLSPEDRTTLQQLGDGYGLLQAYQYSASSATDLANRLSTSLAFYNGLTDAQKSAVRALGIGKLLIDYTPDQIVSYGATTVSAGERITQLAAFFLSLDREDQQALQDIDPFQDSKGGNAYYALFSNGTLDATLLENALHAYEALPDRTKHFLASEGNDYSFVELFLGGTITPTVGLTPKTTTNISPLRTLAEINSLLAGLSADEFAALLDLDSARAVFEKYHLGDSIRDTDVTTALANLKTFVDFYISDLGASQKSTLRELGIVGDNNIAFLGSDPADHTGLGRLLTAYAGLPGNVRASTERLNEFDQFGNAILNAHYGNSQDIKSRSYFFPYGENQTTLTSISFEAAGDLYVGATKYLVIDNSSDSVVSFTVTSGKDIALRASNLIDLTSTTFSSGVRTITMEAATINLTNINFPGGAGVYLNSLYGGTSNGAAVDGDHATNNGAYPNFGSSRYGRVNFISGVKYNGNTIDSTATFNSYGTNIHIGTLTNPVVAPPPTILPP